MREPEIMTMPRRTLAREWRREYAFTWAYYHTLATEMLACHMKAGGRTEEARPLHEPLLAKIDRAGEEFRYAVSLYEQDRSDAIPPNPITHPLRAHLAFDEYEAGLARIRHGSQA